ncbi:hypothetical protein [Bacillus horti]|uniref:Uncharacterized protein n=1 Tax=Caldalkalibacillus horti TaxID=77523 RepID=A0ABT9W5G3_9BACI|nr:hypothetical protein [Bacillus horti]MDQ0168489.1 hypothetical protein [Bacillus horti]
MVSFRSLNEYLYDIKHNLVKKVGAVLLFKLIYGENHSNTSGGQEYCYS